jgi:hypothetical protein
MLTVASCNSMLLITAVAGMHKCNLLHCHLGSFVRENFAPARNILSVLHAEYGGVFSSLIRVLALEQSIRAYEKGSGQKGVVVVRQT